MSEMVGPDGRPPVFDGAAWISSDGRYWWSGAAWQPIKKPGYRPPIAVALIVVVVVVAGVYLAIKIPQPPPAAYGVTNAKIDSSNEFEFDYRRPTTCNKLTFIYVFFDSGKHEVARLGDQNIPRRVLGDHTYHYDTFTYSGMGANPVRFEALPTCLD